MNTNNQENILFYSEVSQLAFKSHSEPSFERLSPVFLKSNNTQALVLRMRDPVEKTSKLIVSFRGSDEEEDWIDNFKFSKKSFDCYGNACGNVHEGFLNYYTNIREMVRTSVAISWMRKEEEGIKKEIVFCGHGLGGSCVLAALDVSFLTDNISVYTYGSPRIGDKTFRNIFNERIKTSFRIVNNEDPIITCPPAIIFSHVGELVLLDPDSEPTNLLEVVRNLVMGIFKNRSLRKKDLLKNIKMETHPVEVYVDKIKSLVYKDVFFKFDAFSSFLY